MQGHRHEIAQFQSDFYRNQFRRILRWLVAAVIVMFLMIGFLIYQLWNKPAQQYYASTTQGKIIALRAEK